MSAVDAPPGISFGGQAAGEFVARRRSRRLAGRVLLLVLITSGVSGVLAVRRVHGRNTEPILVVSLVCASIAGVGYAVRRARLRVDGDGVRWGWSEIGFRVRRDEMSAIDLYRDGVAVRQRRGSTWFLAGGDWERFERMPGALRRARLPAAVQERRAPMRARLQGYGTVLDVLLVADALASVFTLGLALGL